MRLICEESLSKCDIRCIARVLILKMVVNRFGNSFTSFSFVDLMDALHGVQSLILSHVEPWTIVWYKELEANQHAAIHYDRQPEHYPPIFVVCKRCLIFIIGKNKCH